MKNWLIASALLSLPLSVLSCSRSPTLLVTVANLPATSKSFQVEATHAGFATVMDIDPYDLPQPSPASSTFLLRLPANFTGDLAVSIGAFDQPGGVGCLVGTGGNSEMEFMGPDGTLTVSLDPATDTTCSGKKPMLLAVDPVFGKTAGGEMIKLTGWGFKPDGAVTMGTKPTPFTFNSASQVILTTPAHAGFGLTPIRFANKDGNFDLRKDLFRFYSDTLSFTTIPIQNSVTFADTSGFAVGLFDPATTVDLAIALPGTTPGKVRVEFTLNGSVLSAHQQDIIVGNNPGPIVAADFDKDGDLDLLVANINDGTAQLLKNDGAGSFQAGTAFSVGGPGSNPVAMAASDMTGDNVADLAVVNAISNGVVRVFTNDGSGTFTEVSGSPLKAGTNPVSIDIGNIDNDNQADILIANQDDNTANAYINVGAANGLFDDGGQHRYSLPVCAKPTSVRVLDIDSNGKNDLLMSCTDANLVHIIKNNGFPNISQLDLVTEAMPRNMSLTDVNGDGIVDLIVPCQGVDKVDIFLNKQGAGFEGVNYISEPTVCPQPYQTQILDVDGDGKSDLGVAGLGSSSGCLSILFNQSM